ncbi:MAG TPA: CHRD domain-containing protein [Steroidobacteraceae bacterium]|nr:CHRD domain-containing protein [Steroidobacteraceae bacterium]
MKSRLYVALSCALLLGPGLALAADSKVNLTGKEEVPPVQTEAVGMGTITVAADKSVNGSVMTKGMDGIAAHIHQAAQGKNGPPIIPLEKSADGSWSVPKGAKLTDEQYAAYKAGELYVNVHSAAHKGGEIRAQLKPQL